MKKYLPAVFSIAFLIFMLILIMLMSYGCSSTDKSSARTIESYTMNNEAYNSKSLSADEVYYDKSENQIEAEAGYSLGYDADYSYQPQNVQMTSTLPANRKIIRDATLSIQADSVEETYNKLLAAMSDLDGYESSRDMSGEGKNAYISATLKIPAAYLDIFLDEAKGAGKLISSYISSSDITDDYFDSQTRLITLEKTLDKYYEFLEKSTKIDDQLKISNQISDLTYQIESLKGRIRKWDSLVEYSTVSIYISSTPEIIVETREIKWNSLSLDDVKYLAASGFVRITGAIVSTFQWLFIATISLSPIAVPVIAVIIIAIVRTKKKKIKNKKESEVLKNIDSSSN